MRVTKWRNDSFKIWQKGCLLSEVLIFLEELFPCSSLKHYILPPQHSPVSPPDLDHVHFKGMDWVLFIFVPLASSTVTNTWQVPTECLLNVCFLYRQITQHHKIKNKVWKFASQNRSESSFMTPGLSCPPHSCSSRLVLKILSTSQFIQKMCVCGCLLQAKGTVSSLPPSLLF